MGRRLTLQDYEKYMTDLTQAYDVSIEGTVTKNQATMIIYKNFGMDDLTVKKHLNRLVKLGFLEPDGNSYKVCRVRIE